MRGPFIPSHIQGESAGQGSVAALPPKTGLWSLIVTRNPFYLISAACVIHGSAFWFKASGEQSPWALMGLVGFFILLLALTSVAVVRLGRLWDDARSIFLVLFILFVELAVSFDDTFVADPSVGISLLICGFAFALITVELVLCLLRVTVDVRMRVPVHAMIGLLFLYPICMADSVRRGSDEAIHQLLFAWFFCVAACILLLVPAARSRRRLIRGIPWCSAKVAMGCLALGVTALCVRGWTLCMSLDPAILQSVSAARQLPTVFEPWLLTPVILAVLVVLIEFALTHQRPRLASACVLLAGATIVLPFIGSSGTLPELRQQLQGTIGSPSLISMMQLTMVFGWLWIRDVPLSRPAFTIAGLALFCLQLNESGVSRDDQLIMMGGAYCVLHLLDGLRHRRASQAAMAVWLPIAAVLCHAVPGDAALIPCIRTAFVVCLAFGWAMTSRQLLRIAGGLLVASCCLAAIGYPDSVRMADVAGCLAISILLAIHVDRRVFTTTTALCGFCVSLWAGHAAWRQIRSVAGWQGLALCAAGFCTLLAGAGVSCLKARHSGITAHQNANSG